MKEYICENCGKTHDGHYGSGRFCSDLCRRIWSGKKSNITMKERHNKSYNVKSKRSPFGKWKCGKCNLIFETRAKLYDHVHKLHPVQKGSSWNKGLSKDTDQRVAKYVETCKSRNHYISPSKGKKLSDNLKKKISESCKKFYREHPDLVPYKLHHSSKESYPEKYFKRIFRKFNIIGWEYNLPKLGYFLDFGFENQKIDFEVDGSQHWTDKNIIEHDIIRTKVLEESGWTVIRMRWDTWQKKNKSQKIEWINNFKNIINETI